MPDPDKHEREPTQPTQPKKGEPIEIPVPKFGAVSDAIRKVAKTAESTAEDASRDT